MKILEEKMSDLSKYGFEFNGVCWDRYIYIDIDYEAIDREEYVDKNYKTLYVNKNTRELYAYNDYNEERIPLKKEYYKDLEEAGLIEHLKKRKPDNKFEQIRFCEV